MPRVRAKNRVMSPINEASDDAARSPTTATGSSHDLNINTAGGSILEAIAISMQDSPEKPKEVAIENSLSKSKSKSYLSGLHEIQIQNYTFEFQKKREGQNHLTCVSKESVDSVTAARDKKINSLEHALAQQHTEYEDLEQQLAAAKTRIQACEAVIQAVFDPRAILPDDFEARERLLSVRPRNPKWNEGDDGEAEMTVSTAAFRLVLYQRDVLAEKARHLQDSHLHLAGQVGKIDAERRRLENLLHGGNKTDLISMTDKLWESFDKAGNITSDLLQAIKKDRYSDNVHDKLELLFSDLVMQHKLMGDVWAMVYEMHKERDNPAASPPYDTLGDGAQHVMPKDGSADNESDKHPQGSCAAQSAESPLIELSDEETSAETDVEDFYRASSTYQPTEKDSIVNIQEQATQSDVISIPPMSAKRSAEFICPILIKCKKTYSLHHDIPSSSNSAALSPPQDRRKTLQPHTPSLSPSRDLPH